jgi:hypothetical protein
MSTTTPASSNTSVNQQQLQQNEEASSVVVSTSSIRDTSCSNNNIDYQSFDQTRTTRTTTTTTTAGRLPSHQHRHDETNDVESYHNIAPTTTTASYRGFSTSINDMFVQEHQERIDCCSITCCGILQYDYNRYMIQHIYPPSICKRFLVHIVIPICIFGSAGLGAMRIQDTVINEIVSITLMILLLLYIILQFSKGRTNRINVRKEILYTKYQLLQQQQQNQIHNHYNTTTHEQPRRPIDSDRTRTEQNYYLGQTRYDMRCAHPCCLLGCYPDEKIYNTNNTSHNELQQLTTNNMNQYNSSITNNNNICHCLYDFICPSFCGTYIQCCGVCAIAQEGREIESFSSSLMLVPSSSPYRRIDYICTFISIYLYTLCI